MTRRHATYLALVVLILVLPLIELALPRDLRFAGQLRPVMVFAILGLGLNVVTGYTGLLNLGVAAFMAIGVYTYAILTCEIYPFQIGFWWGIAAALGSGALFGLLLGLPTIRLRGDYLAIVTLGFGEITQDVLRNLDSITKGTQSINPLPAPVIGGYVFNSQDYLPWYYLYLALLGLVLLVHRNLERSRVGRVWSAIREDELAASCMGVHVVRMKLLAFAVGAATCAFAGALWAALLGSSGEPGNYDFQISVIALCIVIVGGLGSLRGVLAGALVMIGFNSIVLDKLSKFLIAHDFVSTSNVLASPNNWKFMIFGLALIFMMRHRPEGLLPSRRVAAEMHR